MSGVEVVSLISATITIIEATREIYSLIKDADSLPRVFQVVHDKLRLLTATLRMAQMSIDDQTDDGSFEAMRTIVNKCNSKAQELEEIFTKIAPENGGRRLDRYRKVVRRLGKGKQVEVLTKEILEDVCLLAENRAVGTATNHQVAKLAEAIDDMASREPSVPDADSATYSHSGSGAINVHDGSGEFYSVSGEGRQFFMNDSSFDTLNFGKN